MLHRAATSLSEFTVKHFHAADITPPCYKHTRCRCCDHVGGARWIRGVPGAVLNILSELVLVAQMHMYFWANLTIKGYFL